MYGASSLEALVVIISSTAQCINLFIFVNMALVNIVYNIVMIYKCLNKYILKISFVLCFLQDF